MKYKLFREILSIFKEKYVGEVFFVADLEALYEETEEGYADDEFYGLCREIEYALTKFPELYKNVDQLATIIRYEFLNCFHDTIATDIDIYKRFARDILQLVNGVD
jgi:hypothetical protein